MDPGVGTAFGLVSAGFGLLIVLMALGVVPRIGEVHAPGWVMVAAGIVFVFLGIHIFRSTVRSVLGPAPAEEGGPVDGEEPFSVVGWFLKAGLVSAFAAVAIGVAGSAGGIVWGLATLLLVWAAGWIWRDGFRRLRARLEGDDG